MLDLNHLPIGADVQIFLPNSNVQLTAGAPAWNRPRGKSMACIFALGCGGAGGGGFVGAVAAAGGGGGGGSGTQGMLVIPICFLPDTLYVQVCAGGAGSGIGSTIVSVQSTINTANDFVIACGPGGVGSNGTNAAGGGGGASGGANTIASNSRLAGLGKMTYFDGQAGNAGGFNTTAPTAITYPTTGIVTSGGAGGGGIQTSIGTAGASVNGAGLIPSSTGGAAGASGVAGIDGSCGMSFLAQLKAFTGGAGGGSGFPVATTSNGGNGGVAGYGCGGGGGGGAVTGKTAGTGGRGGDGIVIIICW